MEKIKVAIADDQTLFRQTLGSLIKGVDSFELLAEAESGESFINQMRRLTPLPDVALIDMKMPGMSGIDLNRLLHRDYPLIKVIVLSAYNEKRLISTMIDAGARSYLEKACDMEELISAITNVHRHDFYMNSQVLSAIQNPAANRYKPVRTFTDIPVEITKREKEILRLICEEYSNAEIADQLFLSIRTVEGHRNNLLLKTGCKNTAGLVLFAVKHNIYDLTLH